jgi:hypothetical protein
MDGFQAMGWLVFGSDDQTGKAIMGLEMRCFNDG